MKYTLDTKSAIIGFLGAALLISTISFKNGNNNDRDGKYTTVVGQEGTVVILDSQNGSYIIAPSMKDFGKVQWIKGDFESTHKSGKDNKKE